MLRKDVSTARLEDKSVGDFEDMVTEDASQQRETLHTDERRQSHNVTSLEIRDMDITTPDVIYIMESTLTFNYHYLSDRK